MRICFSVTAATVGALAIAGDVGTSRAIAQTPAPLATAPVATRAAIAPGTKPDSAHRWGPALERAAVVPGLDSAIVATLVRQWEPDLMYCYTELGIKERPELTGSIGVRIALTSAGAVGAADIVTRAWSEPSGFAAVESCVRTRVSAWKFPPAASPSTHDFTVNFAR